MNTLKFVSFKIEVDEDEYATLSDPDVWPEGVAMRPFVENKKFGDFLPPMNKKPTNEAMVTETYNHTSNTGQ